MYMNEEAPKMPITDLKMMNQDDKDECARYYRNKSFETAESASRRGGELSDEFTRLEVQIATILLAFTSLFLGFFTKTSIGFSSLIVIFSLKLIFSSGIFFLILSLVIGMLHIKRKEMFWGDALHVRAARHKNWATTVKRDYTFEQGLAFHNGTNAGRDIIVSSPKWTWILQTICLGIAVVELFILFLVFLFH